MTFVKLHGSYTNICSKASWGAYSFKKHRLLRGLKKPYVAAIGFGKDVPESSYAALEMAATRQQKALGKSLKITVSQDNAFDY